MATALVLRASAAPHDLTASVLVVDSRGHALAALEAADLGVPLLEKQMPHVPGETRLVAFAAYGRPSWEAVRRIAERVPTIVLASPVDHEDALRAIGALAVGYTDLELSPEALRRAMLAAFHGELVYPRRVLAEFVRRQVRAPEALRLGRLTPRQREVVALVARGKADKEIALALGISTATAQKHVTNVLRRLDVPNRAAAAAATAMLFASP